MNKKATGDVRRTVVMTVDLELTGYDGPGGCERLLARLQELLAVLADMRATITFFCTGDVLQQCPDAVLAIHRAGHEVACHGMQHVPLDALGRQQFAQGLADFRRLADALGVGPVQGFRAPFMSLTHDTAGWAGGLLQDAGFAYDASAVPCRAPLYGMPGIPRGLHAFGNGLVEVPVTVYPFRGPFGVPVFSGTYLRLLPAALLRGLMQRAVRHGPIIGYFHLYDLDPAVSGLRVFRRQWMNRLLAVGQRSFLAKVRMLLSFGEVSRMDGLVKAMVRQ